jgi:hypothetical protein
MTGPSNRELFEYLSSELAFSVFRREGDRLVSFKETIELTFLPEGTADGPPEGLLFEGTAPMAHAEWLDFVAGFAMTSIESRHDAGEALSRTYRAQESAGSRLHLLSLRRDLDTPDGAPREEVVSECSRYLWGSGTVAVYARMIACRGADQGMPARQLLREKLERYRQRRR